jgi:hypothetical protein
MQISVISYWGFRSRIPFSALLLQVVMDVSKHHKSVYYVAFTSLFIQAALSVWFTFTSIAMSVRFPPADAVVLTFCMNSYTTWTPGNPTCSTSSSCSSGKVAGLLFFATFSYIWTTQVVGNVTLATLAGGPYGSTPESLFCYHMDLLFSRLVLLRSA